MSLLNLSNTRTFLQIFHPCKDLHDKLSLVCHIARLSWMCSLSWQSSSSSWWWWWWWWWWYDDDDQLRCLFSVPFHPRAETILGPEFETNQITPNFLCIFIVIIVVIIKWGIWKFAFSGNEVSPPVVIGRVVRSIKLIEPLKRQTSMVLSTRCASPVLLNIL